MLRTNITFGFLFLFVTLLFLTDRSTRTSLIESCYDGDTCRLKTPSGIYFNIRLVGIDAPELKSKRFRFGQPGSEAARKYLDGRLRGQRVKFEQSGLDRFNRPVGEIYLGGELINIEMVRLGYAEVFRKIPFINREKYLADEEVAKANRIGIWQDAKYLSPGVFRKRF